MLLAKFWTNWTGWVSFKLRIDVALEISVDVLFNEKVAQVYDRWYETKKRSAGGLV